MPANRRRTDATGPPEAWQLLGRLLEGRRKELGYTYRYPAFERDTGINRRMQADIEKAAKDRINRFMPGALHVIARGYQVTEGSMRAVLRGEAEELVPAARPGNLSVARILPDEDAPIDDPAREAAARPKFYPILQELLRLRDEEHIDEPSGEQLGLSPADAKVWEGSRGAMSQSDRAWLVADIQARRAARNAAPNDRAAGA